MNGCKLDPEDLFLLSEPIMYHGYGNMMASKAPKGMDINDVTFHNRKLAWIGFFKGELARRADYRNKGVPEDVGIEKVVRVLGSTNGDSLFSHMPVARFGYIPKG